MAVGTLECPECDKAGFNAGRLALHMIGKHCMRVRVFDTRLEFHRSIEKCWCGEEFEDVGELARHLRHPEICWTIKLLRDRRDLR